MSSSATDQELLTRLRQQEILASVGAMALSGASLDDLFQESTRLIARGLETQFCKILEYRPTEDAFLVRAGVGWREGVVGNARIPGDTLSPAGYAFKTDQEVISNALGDDERFKVPDMLQEHGIQRAMNVIIRTDTGRFGVLEADSPENPPFGARDLAFMQAAANLLGIALHRRHIETELARSHAHVTEVLESISDAFYAVDHDWRFIYFNRNAEILWRRRRSDLLGQSYLDEFPSSLGPVIHETHLRAARERRVLSVEAHSPVLGRWLDVSIFPSADGLSVYMRDITDRKETETALQAFTRILEDRVADRTRELAETNQRLLGEIAERRRAETALMQAQRLEAIGQLTGGIAHDFNNLLTAVIGNLELLLRVQPTDRARFQASAALEAAQRGATLTRQLLAYARKQHIESRPLDLNKVIEGMRDMMKRSLGGLVAIETSFATDGWLAMADPVQVETVVLNLAINARDAMPRGGRLRITTSRVPANAPDLPAPLEARDYLRIAVTDEGMGMAPEVAARAFEPFFTTKDVGTGSGLGLAQVLGVATQFGGTARLSSAPDCGTTVEVFLPRADASDRPATEAVSASVAQMPTPAMIDGRILVIDDQDDVRAIGVTFLAEAGFDTDEAASGEAGLRALAEQPYVLALVDYGMAGMSGTEFVRKARLQHPDLRIIYVTGYADPLDRFGIDPKDAILTKPYQPNDLITTVQRMLASVTV